MDAADEQQIMTDAAEGDALVAQEGPRRFSLVNQASMRSPVERLSWCATMDLLAVVTADGALTVLRCMFWVS
jgi:hypothetical protein